MKFLKNFLKVLALIILIIIILFGSIGVFVHFSDPNRYKAYFVKIFDAQTGQKIALQGPIHFEIFPFPYVKLTNADMVITFNKAKYNVHMASVRFELELFSLFSDTLRYKEIKAEKVTINNEIKIDAFNAKAVVTSCYIKFPQFEIKNKGNVINGNLMVHTLADIPNITGKITMKKWEVPSQISDIRDTMLSWLSTVDTNIDLLIQELRFRNITLSNVTSKLTTKKQNIKINSNGQYPTGDFVVNLSFFDITKNPIDIYLMLQNKDQDKITGKMQLKNVQNQWQLEGELNTTAWHIPDFLTQSEWMTTAYPEITADIKLNAARLIFGEIEFNNLNGQMHYDHDQVNIRAKGMLAGGDFDSEIKVLDLQAKQPANLNFVFDLKSAKPSEFLKIFHSDVPLEGGKVDVNFRGKTSHTESTLIKHLSGEGLMRLQDFTLLNYRLDSRMVDVWSNLFKMFAGKKRNSTHFDCAVFKFSVQEGLLEAKESLGLATQDLYALGGGKIDLHTSKLNFMFDIYPRSQLNIEIGSMENVLIISGTLENPQFRVSPRGMIKETGSLLLGFATGGLSLLAEKLTKILTQKGSPCEYVLEEQK